MEELQTTIRLKKETKNLLDTLKIIDRESYDSVILRMIEYMLEEKLGFNQKTQSMIMDRLNAAKSGKVMSDEELLKRVKERK